MREVHDEDPSCPSRPPSTTDPQCVDESQSSSQRLLPPEVAEPEFESSQPSQGFEKPSLFRIAILTLLCLITYPTFYILTLVAKDKSLFIVRSIVGAWCWGVGYVIGLWLLKIGAQHLEAAGGSTLVGYRYILRLYFNSLGHRDSHEL